MVRNNEVATKQPGEVDGRPGAGQRLVTPAVDVIETPDTYVLRLEIPGAVRESVAVKLEGESLHVRADIAGSKNDAGTVLYSEMKGTAYSREFTLGNGVDRERVDAAYELGVLTVRLQKSPAMVAKEIRIQ